MAAQEYEAAWEQTLSNRPNNISTAFDMETATEGRQTSDIHKTPPPAINIPAIGTRARFAAGPITEARPNVTANNGHKAAAIATLIPANVQAARIGLGHDFGEDASRRRATINSAAVPPKLIRAPADKAAAGSKASNRAAANVKVADGVVGLSSRREMNTADNIKKARNEGGSPPAIKA